MKPRILVVDDNPDICDVYGTLLRSQGYHADAVESGSDALKRLEKYPYNLILLDIMMPEMDGLHILNIVKNDPRQKNVKVVMVTALGDKSLREAATSYGADEYIVKSEIELKEMLEIIERILAT